MELPADTCKNNVKTLFLICNSFGFLCGWSVVVNGVGNTAINGSNYADSMIILQGVWVIVVTLVGYSGAFMERAKTLHVYSCWMVIFVTRESVLLSKSKPPPRAVDHKHDNMSEAEEAFIGLILLTVLTLVSLLLSLSLSGLVSPDDDNADTHNTDKREQDAAGESLEHNKADITDKLQPNTVARIKPVNVV